jgi:hypothetical protein
MGILFPPLELPNPTTRLVQLDPSRYLDAAAIPLTVTRYRNSKRGSLAMALIVSLDARTIARHDVINFAAGILHVQ